MSAYALTPLAKADIFDIWSYIANDSEDAASRVEQAIYDACAFVAEAPTRGHFRSDPHNPAAALLDAAPLSELHRRVPARNGATPDGCRSPRQKKHTPHADAAPITHRRLRR
jgi:plasmid stabilization system protein ParE